MQQIDHLKKEMKKKDAEMMSLRRLVGELERNQKKPTSKQGVQSIENGWKNPTPEELMEYFDKDKYGTKFPKKPDDGQPLVEVARKMKEIKSLYEPSKNMC